VAALTPITQIPHEVGALQAALPERDAVIAGLSSRIDDLRQMLAQMQARLDKLLHARFGASSEKWCPGQGELYTETASVPLPPPAPTVTIEAHERKRAGRPALPDDLPRERKEYELGETERAGFDRVVRIGEEVCSTLEFTPPQWRIIDHVRGKYRCEKDGESTIRTAFAEPSPLPKSNAGSGLLAHIAVAKYLDGLPLYRQQRQFARYGLALSRNTMCDWLLRLTPLLEVLYAALRSHVLRAPVIFGDDTPHELLAGGHGSTVTARLWAYVSCGQVRTADGAWAAYPRAAYFEYSQTRQAKHPLKLLGEYRGYLQADDFSGWHPLLKTGRVLHVACMAHYPERSFIWGLRRHELIWCGVRGSATRHKSPLVRAIAGMRAGQASVATAWRARARSLHVSRISASRRASSAGWW
jgi:transposase